MNAITKDALALLRSLDFFSQLRGALAREGLAGEEKFGVGVFFTMSSRFRPNPLRVELQEMTEGGAKYMVRRVARLLQPGTICGVSSEQGWSRFAEDPTHRVAYVRQWSDGLREGVRFDINGNKLARVSRRERAGRIVETPETIEGPFACIAEQYPWEAFDRSRWLSIQLPTPPPSAPNGMMALDDDEISTWMEVQRLLQERARLPILLPDWGDVFIEHPCADERAARHLPAFLQAWQTMSLLRSFRGDKDGQPRDMLMADFEDLAATSMLMRGVFKESHWFPSPKKIFNEVFPVGEERGVINPLTGKGVRYTRHPDKPAQEEYVPLDVV